MNVTEWNQALSRWFFPEAPGRPAYFSATPSELREMCDGLGIDLPDPAADLRQTLDSSSLRQARRAHARWKDEGCPDPPPWLAFLAASVVVVESQMEAGRSGFYDPLSDFIGLPYRLSQEDYEGTFYVWWTSLAQWLEIREGGRRGFATWRAIPSHGFRCVIGHPYTQVLLRQEERRQLDAFLSDFSSENSDLPELTDRRAAGRHLVAALRRWARGGRTIGARLRGIVEGSSEDSLDTLGYLLVDRLFDHQLENDQISGHRIAVVPVFDELDRELHLAAIAPAWVSESEPLNSELCEAPMTVPGQPYRLSIPPSDEFFREGFACDGEQGISFVSQGRVVHALARRDWDLWCGVPSAAMEEHVYLLTPREYTTDAPRFAKPIEGLPDHWAVHGPTTLGGARGSGLSDLIEKERRLIPRLRGGLALEGRGVYQTGGEPIVELPGLEGFAKVDDQAVPFADEELRLASLALGAGTHRVEVGPFLFEFSSLDVVQSPNVHPLVGRTRTGDVVLVAKSDEELVSGYRNEPERARTWMARLTPLVEEVVLLGPPGEVGVVSPRRAEWSDRCGLPHVAVELAARSTYPHGDRIVKAPWFVAWHSSDWYIAHWRMADTASTDAWIDERAWRAAIDRIGTSPLVHTFGHQSDLSQAEVLSRWRDYVSLPVVV